MSVGVLARGNRLVGKLRAAVEEPGLTAFARLDDARPFLEEIIECPDDDLKDHLKALYVSLGGSEKDLSAEPDRQRTDDVEMQAPSEPSSEGEGEVTVAGKKRPRRASSSEHRDELSSAAEAKKIKKAAGTQPCEPTPDLPPRNPYTDSTPESPLYPDPYSAQRLQEMGRRRKPLSGSGTMASTPHPSAARNASTPQQNPWESAHLPPSSTHPQQSSFQKPPPSFATSPRPPLPAPFETRIMLPVSPLGPVGNVAGQLIGRNGANVKELTRTCGARLNIGGINRALTEAESRRGELALNCVVTANDQAGFDYACEYVNKVVQTSLEVAGQPYSTSYPASDPASYLRRRRPPLPAAGSPTVPRHLHPQSAALPIYPPYGQYLPPVPPGPPPPLPLAPPPPGPPPPPPPSSDF